LALSVAVCVALAGYGHWQANRDPDLRVEVPDIDVGNVQAEAERLVEYVVVNRERDPVRLVGTESC